MDKFAVTAAPHGGEHRALEGLLSLELSGGLHTPALSLSATFCPAALPPSFREVRVQREGELLFQGGVDEQRGGLSGVGLRLELEARSAGALLLDNEALPQTFYGANLSAVFAKCAAPYGFALYNPQENRTLPSYTLYKGTSEWEAICGFCRRAHGLEPYVEDGVIWAKKPDEGQMLTLSNTGTGLPFTALEHLWAPYQILSHVHVRDEGGGYATVVENSAAEALGIRRKRYVVPQGEFAENGEPDARRRIEQSMLAAERVSVTLPGFVPVRPGQAVRVLDKHFTLHNLMVQSWRYRLSSAGLTSYFLLGKRG